MPGIAQKHSEWEALGRLEGSCRLGGGTALEETRPSAQALRVLALQGDSGAMVELLGRALAHKKIAIARTHLQDDYLRVSAEAEAVPDERVTVTLIRRELESWARGQITYVEVDGRRAGDEFCAWSRAISLNLPLPPPQPLPEEAPAPLRFDPFRLVGIALIGLYGLFGFAQPVLDGPFRWLHFPDLAIHETGHLLFLVFGGGSFLHILGGSLTQILFPAVCSAYFYIAGQRYSSAVTLFWTAQNFVDVSIYIKDARARMLPLTTPNPDAHDWYNLLGMTNLLAQDQLIGNLAYGCGVLLFVASLALGVLFSRETE